MAVWWIDVPGGDVDVEWWCGGVDNNIGVNNNIGIRVEFEFEFGVGFVEFEFVEFGFEFVEFEFVGLVEFVEPVVFVVLDHLPLPLILPDKLHHLTHLLIHNTTAIIHITTPIDDPVHDPIHDPAHDPAHDLTTPIIHLPYTLLFRQHRTSIASQLESNTCNRPSVRFGPYCSFNSPGLVIMVAAAQEARAQPGAAVSCLPLKRGELVGCANSRSG